MEHELLIRLMRLCFISFLGLSCALAGCASSQRSMDPARAQKQLEENLEAQIAEAEKQKFSDALHSYLVGQLQLERQETNDALTSLEKADKLSTEQIPELSAVLSDLYIRQGRLPEALRETDRALGQLAQGDQGKRILLSISKAEILLAMEKSSQAMTVYAELYHTASSDWRVALAYAQVLLRTGAVEQAQKILIPFLNQPEAGREIQFSILLGDALGSSGQAHKPFSTNPLSPLDEMAVFLPDQAIFILSNYYLSGQNETASMLRARLLSEFRLEEQLQQGLEELDHARQSQASLKLYAKKIAARCTETTHVQFRLAFEFMRRREVDLARSLLSLATQQSSQNTNFYSVNLQGLGQYLLGTLAMLEEKHIEAIAELRLVREDNPYYARAKVFEGVIHQSKGNFKKAEKAFRQAIEKEPQDLRLRGLLIESLRQLGDRKAVVSEMKEIESRYPDQPPLMLQYALALHEHGQEEESREKLREIITKFPTQLEPMNALAYSYADRGENLVEANNLIQYVLVQSPTAPQYLDTYAWVLFKSGKFPQALEQIEKAILGAPQDPVLLEHAGDILAALGREAEAQQKYFLALEYSRKENNYEVLESRARLEKKIKSDAKDYKKLFNP